MRKQIIEIVSYAFVLGVMIFAGIFILDTANKRDFNRHAKYDYCINYATWSGAEDEAFVSVLKDCMND